MQEKPDYPEFKEAIYLNDGRIDCQILHPKFGWIPTTLDPTDDEVFYRLVSESGSVAEYVPEPVTKAQVNDECDRRIQEFFGVSDKVSVLAKQLGYGNELQKFAEIERAGGELSVEEGELREAIIQGYAGVSSIVAASNYLTSLFPIPTDFADDKYW